MHYERLMMAIDKLAAEDVKFQPKEKQMDEQELEQQLQNKPAPRVTLAQIEALMARVQYLGGRVGETTSTVVHAFLDGEFMLASGHSACVSAANFDADLGFKMAKENAEKKARDALWQFEGYYLRCKLRKENDAPVFYPTFTGAD